MDQNNNSSSTTNHQEKVLEKALSFRDLPLEGCQDLSDHIHHHQSPSSPSHELFEFPPLTPKTTPLNNRNDFVFDDEGDDEISRYLFPLSSARLKNNGKEDMGSLRLVNSKPTSSSALSAKNLKSQSCSSSYSLSQHKVVIGIKKIPPKMELSEIKKRQSKRNPSPMFPSVNLGDLEVMATGDGCPGAAGGRSHHWSLLRPLRGRAHFVSALAKATLGCIPHV